MAGSDIDIIWQALKEEDGASCAKSFCISTKAKCSAASDEKLVAKHKFIESLHCTPAFDVDRFDIRDVISEPSSYVSSVATKGTDTETITTILGTAGLHTSAAASLDSDDDSDNDEEVTTEDATRISQLVGQLKSEVASTRVIALNMLKKFIGALSCQCYIAPELNFSPPFNESNTRLDKNLPLVSDLATAVNRELGVVSDDKPSQSMHPAATIYSPDARDQLQKIMDLSGKRLFQLIGDESEKCRSLSIECLNILFLAGVDPSQLIPYLIPALSARYSSSTYDKDLEVFVSDDNMHEFYKRGGAVDRQDRDGLLSQGSSFQLREPNEEVRYELCRTFTSLVRGAASRHALPILDAYFSDMILVLQTSLKDPFPDVKVTMCQLIVQLLRVPQWETGAKHFATGLARAVLPNLRHRKSNVIIAAIDLFEASVCVPDRAKVKGAGSSAISDLVGFREENVSAVVPMMWICPVKSYFCIVNFIPQVLPIAAFYDSSCAVSVNTLAELAAHKNPRVRARCCEMLSNFLVYLPDRYDHQQRLLPYVLAFINDPSPIVQLAALECIDKCGCLYENEHPDDVIERVQLGVDGESSIDYDSGLPQPFTRRPSLGARLFVRSNTSRFYLALLGELSNWKGHTRKRSADLLLIMTVYCEEHLTKDFQHTISSIAKAIELETRNENESAYLNTLESISEVVCLMSKYVNPAVYLPLFAPIIFGDSTSGTSYAEDGAHSEKTRYSHLIILSSLVQGAPLHRLIPYWQKMLTLVANDDCIGPFAGSKVHEASLKALSILVNRVQDGDNMNRLVNYLHETGNASKTVAELQLLSQNGGRMVGNECYKKISRLVSSIEQN